MEKKKSRREIDLENRLLKKENADFKLDYFMYKYGFHVGDKKALNCSPSLYKYSTITLLIFSWRINEIVNDLVKIKCRYRIDILNNETHIDCNFIILLSVKKWSICVVSVDDDHLEYTNNIPCKISKTTQKVIYPINVNDIHRIYFSTPPNSKNELPQDINRVISCIRYKSSRKYLDLFHWKFGDINKYERKDGTRLYKDVTSYRFYINPTKWEHVVCVRMSIINYSPSSPCKMILVFTWHIKKNTVHVKEYYGDYEIFFSAKDVISPFFLVPPQMYGIDFYPIDPSNIYNQVDKLLE